MNNLLVLSPLKAGAVVEEMDFSKCPSWVQIHGFPIEKMSRANAEIIGKRFGRLLAIETSPDNILLARSFLRVKVEINIDQPLPKGFWIRRAKICGFLISMRSYRISAMLVGGLAMRAEVTDLLLEKQVRNRDMA